MGIIEKYGWEIPVVFVDVETNGQSHIRGRVIEVAAIRVENGKVTRTFNQLINPGSKIPAFITDLTGIRDQDLRGAVSFRQIAAELQDVMSGAVFIAHNVRFDYSFLKQEFKRVSRTFLPKQACTVKLSRTLHPEHRSHKLESLIARHGFSFEHRHRAYDDAHVLWQFLQKSYTDFPVETVNAAITKQLRQPALPKGLQPDLVKDLPNEPGVYIFEDEQQRPLYIGKSINIRKRVLSHFGRDHDDGKEYRIAQAIRHISTITTGGELQALLLESRLVKEMQPLYNRKLRRTQKLMLAKLSSDEQGFSRVTLEEASRIETADIGNTLAVYDRRSRAKTSLLELQKLYDLCPKLLGLEKFKGACFMSQLRRCRGACTGKESPESYNVRLALAFERQRLKTWPYSSPILVREGNSDSGVVIDQWCVIAEINQQEFCDPDIQQKSRNFDLDTYKILQDFLTRKLDRLRIQPLDAHQLQELAL